MADPTKTPHSIEFPNHEKGSTRPRPLPQTPPPPYPGNTVVENPQISGDEPYFPSRPAVPDQK